MTLRLLPLLAGSALIAATVLSDRAPASPPPAPTPDEIKGQRLYIRCASCHAIAANAPAKIGPNLRGVVGRRAAAMPGYRYSPAMRARRIVWDDATLDRWLARPSAVVPGTSMAFAGLSRPEDRRALIAYMRKNGR